MKRLITCFLILLGIICFLANALYQVKTAGNVPAFTLRTTDVYLGFLPCLSFARDSLLRGSFPLWDPHAAAGIPFFANVGLGLLYPINWVILLFDVPLAMLIIQAMTVSIGMAGAVLYLRYLKLEWPAVVLGTALYGSVVLMDSFSLAFGSTHCWFPYVLLATHRLVDRPTYGRCLLLTAAFALCFLGGYFQYFYYICIVTAVYAGMLLLISWSERQPRDMLITCALICLALILSIGLVSIQLVPTLELSLSSVRSASANLNSQTVHWLDKFSLIKTFQYALARSSPVNRMDMPYMGVGLFLIPFALFSRSHTKVAIPVLAALGYVILFVVAKENPSFAIFGKLPFSSAFRWHERFIMMTHLLTAVLAAIGLSSLLNRPWNGLTKAGTARIDGYAVFILLYMLALMIPILVSMQKVVTISPNHFVVILPALIVLAMLLMFNSRADVRLKICTASMGVLLLSGIAILYGGILRKDVKFLILLLGLALLIPHFLNMNQTRKWRVFSMFAAGVIIVSAIVFQDQFDGIGNSVVALIGGVIFARSASGLPYWVRKAAAWLVLLFLLVDLMPYRNYAATVPAFTYNTTDVFDRQLDWIRRNAGYDRVYMNPGGYPYIHLAANAGSMYGFQSINSFYSFTLGQWENFVRFVIGEQNFNAKYGYWRFHGYIESDMEKFFLTRSDLDGIASLRYLLTCYPVSETARGKHWQLKYRSEPPEAEFYVYENQLALPRAYLVSGYLLINSAEDKSLLTTARLVSKLSSLVVLEDAAPSFASTENPAFSGKADITRYENEKVEVRADAQAPSLLVLTDNYYSGWTATVDGMKTPIWRANSLFRAVEVPSGSHTVIFQYRPASLLWGMGISGLTILFIVAGFLFKRRFSRVSPERALEPVPESV